MKDQVLDLWKTITHEEYEKKSWVERQPFLKSFFVGANVDTELNNLEKREGRDLTLQEEKDETEKRKTTWLKNWELKYDGDKKQIIEPNLIKKLKEIQQKAGNTVGGKKSRRRTSKKSHRKSSKKQRKSRRVRKSRRGRR
tara:strand:- start:1421 stop:1840 length:420 start_codon:yes stop_codon:yes gene_type:complete